MSVACSLRSSCPKSSRGKTPAVLPPVERPGPLASPALTPDGGVSETVGPPVAMKPVTHEAPGGAFDPREKTSTGDDPLIVETPVKS